MKTIAIQLAAALTLALAPAAAIAGKGGSARAIESAVASTSVDAIIAELERTESLACDACIDIITNLTADPRYEVREVAAWWFAKRPVLKDMLVAQFTADLPGGDTTAVRNAADFLGRTRTYAALPALRAALGRSDVGTEGRIAVVRAVGFMAHTRGNDILIAAMADADAGVRAQAVEAWRHMRDQKTAQPVVALLGDADAVVRARAAGVVGGLVERSARGALESLVVADPDPRVRRNAAWALGELGDAASRAALLRATTDTSGLVRGVARASLAQLR